MPGFEGIIKGAGCEIGVHPCQLTGEGELGQVYVTMGLLAGGNVSAHTNAEKKCPPTKAAALA